MAVRSALSAGRPLPPGRFLISVTRLSQLQGHSAAGRIRSIEKSNDLIGNRARDLPTCSIMPQPTMLQRAHTYTRTYTNVVEWSLEDLRGDYNIKIGLKEVIRIEKVYWIHLAQDIVQWRAVERLG
jgi:hypothetical protein